MQQVRPGGRPASRPAGLHPALAALADQGVLEARDAAACGVRDLSRAHPVWGVHTPEGQALVVKLHAADRGAVDLGIEFLVYRMAVWCEPLRDALPTALVVDEDAHLLVLEDVGGASLAIREGFPPQLGHAAPGGAASDPHLFSTLGRTLGALHRGTAGLPLPPARPPVALAGLSGLAPLEGEGGRVCAALASEAVFADAARQLVGPVNGCLVSHDMKWDNVVVRPDGRLVLLDWELAGLGDPAVDLGFLLAEHLVRAEGAVTDAARALLAGYASAAPPRPEVAGVLARRTSLAAGLRIGQLAVEVAGGDPGAVAALTDLARAVLADADALTREVLACLA